MKTNENKRKEAEDQSTVPGFIDQSTSLKLKWVEKNTEPVGSSFQAFNIDKLQKSLKQRPWILPDRITHSKKLNRKLLDKVTPNLRPEEPWRLELDCAPVFHPTKEEFENTLQYIAKIRLEAERYGICSIVPPDSWQPQFPNEEKEIWETSRFHTNIQPIDELQSLYSKRELKTITEKLKRNKTSDYGSGDFEFESGPELTLQTFKKHAEDFEADYFQKEGILTPTLENVEDEYWRIVQNPTEKVQVLCGHNLEAKVLGSEFPFISDETEYVKSGWNLNNTSKLSGSLLAFDSCENSGVSSPHVDVGMCFSSVCWKVEEHNLYLLSYLPLGASRIWYSVPGRYSGECEAALKKRFPELLGHSKLFHKLVSQLSPSTLKSEGLPVYRCVQHPKQFVLVFPGAYSSGFNTGFNISMRVNLAPLDWLPYGQQSVEIYSELHRKTSISYDKLLIDACRNTAKKSWLLKLKRDSKEWKLACGNDGWLTRALKSRVKWEHLRRELLCNGSQSRTMDVKFWSTMKQECIVCNFDLYLSATGCLCSPDRYTCLQHSKQLCSCAWSSRIFLFHYTIVELNLLIDALEGKLNALYRWANQNPELFFDKPDGK